MSTTHPPFRIVTTHDVVRQIFAVSDLATKAACARVCQYWQEAALDSLWEHKTDLVPLLQVLSPLTALTARAPYKFQFTWDAKNWDRFFFYSSRIRYLHLTQKVEDIDQSVFQELGRSRMNNKPVFLPRLVSFKMSSDSQIPMLYSILFLQHTILTLDIKLPTDSATANNYLEEIASRAPNIRTLVLRFKASIQPFEATVVKMLTLFTQLRQLTFPEYAITQRVMSALSTLPKLHTISLLFPSEGLGVRKDVEAWLPVFKGDAFPSLKTLSTSAGFSDITHFLRDESGPHFLSSLTISTATLETPKSTRSLLFTIPDRSSSLTYLCINLILGCKTTVAADLASVNYVQFVDIKPILGIASIKIFRIFHHHRLVLADDNILEIARAWPALEELWLNPDPITDVSHLAGLTPSCLTHFRNRCPSLHVLGLHIDFSVPCDELEGPVPADSKLMGLGLDRLELGTSPITQDQVDDTAVFLSALVTTTCNVVTGNDWPTVINAVLAGLPDRMAKIQKQWAAWDTVRRLLPIIVKVRQQERTLVGTMKSS